MRQVLRGNPYDHDAVTDFDFASEPADADRLIALWSPEIEQIALSHIPDDRLISFLTATLRLAPQSKSLKDFNLMNVIEKVGYSPFNLLSYLRRLYWFTTEGIPAELPALNQSLRKLSQ